MEIYRGIIEDNKSPLKDGRVQVRIIGIHDAEIPTSDLPWAEVMQSLFLGYGSGIGVTSIPRTGTWVFLTLDHDDENKPIVISAISGKAEEGGSFQLPKSSELNKYDTNKLALDEYPDNHVLESFAGHTIEIDDFGGNERIKIKHTSGTYIEMLPDGSVFIDIKKDLTTKVAGNTIIDTVGTTLIQSAGAVTIKGSTIDLNP